MLREELEKTIKKISFNNPEVIVELKDHEGTGYPFDSSLTVTYGPNGFTYVQRFTSSYREPERLYEHLFYSLIENLIVKCANAV